MEKRSIPDDDDVPIDEVNAKENPLEEIPEDQMEDIINETENFNPEVLPPSDSESTDDKEEEVEEKPPEKKDHQRARTFIRRMPKKENKPETAKETEEERSEKKKPQTSRKSTIRMPKKEKKPETPRKLTKTPKKRSTQTTQQLQSPTIQANLHKIAVTPPKSKILKRRPFSADEVKYMKFKFDCYLSTGSLAPLHDCDELVEAYPAIFKNRSGRDVYNWIQYQRNKKKKH